VQATVDVCRALRYLHARRPSIVHGDLKDSNILVERLHDKVRAKLLDFGLSRVLTAGARPLGGTLRWMAPELISDRRMPPSVAADVFSFGRLAFMISTCDKPLQSVTDTQIRELAQAGTTPVLVWPEDDPCCLPTQALVQQCVCVDSVRRPSFVEVLEEVMLWPAVFGPPNSVSIACSQQQSFTTSVARFATSQKAANAIPSGMRDDGPVSTWWSRRLREKEIALQKEASSASRTESSSANQTESSSSNQTTLRECLSQSDKATKQVNLIVSSDTISCDVRVSRYQPSDHDRSMPIEPERPMIRSAPGMLAQTWASESES